MTEHQIQLQNSARTRSITTFTAGASLTIASNASVTLIIRHPRTVPIRRAEARAKTLLSSLSEPDFILTRSFLHRFITALFLIAANLLPLLPIALHIIHQNALVTILAHIPAALLCLFIHYLLTLFPHKPYLAITPTHVIHRPRGLLSNIRSYPLSILRSFTHNANCIIADTISPRISLKAPDKQTASAAVQALNTALDGCDGSKPPENLLHTTGQVVITATTSLCEYELPCKKLDIKTIGDRLNIKTIRPRFPRVGLIFGGFVVTHAIATVLLIFVFDDVPRRIEPITASMISIIALGGVYIACVVLILGWFVIRCMPKKWKLLIVGYRKDVKAGMIDVGKCREVLLVRDRKGFGVRVVSSTGNRFLDVGGLSEGEAAKLLGALRSCFPTLFQGSV